MKLFRRLHEPTQAHIALLSVWAEIKPYLRDGRALELVIRPETRSTVQNSRMWALLTEVSQQVVWHGRKLSPEAWKHVFSSALKKQDIVPNIDGTGFVVLGMSTSQMSRGEMAEMMDLIEAFGAQHDVKFSLPEEIAA